MNDQKKPLCQTCQREAGIKKVLTANGKSKRWKCLSCINKVSVSFIKIKQRRIK